MTTQSHGLRRASWISILMLAALAACSVQETDRSETAAAPASSEGWRTERTTEGDVTWARTIGANSALANLVLERELTLGLAGGPPEAMFGRISAVAALQDGGVVLYEATARLLRLFDSTGAFVRTVGGRGDGPGEYTSVSEVLAAPDGRIFAAQTGRIMWFSASGEPLGNVSVQYEDPRSQGLLLAVDESAVLHVRRGVYPPDNPDSLSVTGRRVTVSAVLRIREDGRVIDTVPTPRPMNAAKGWEYQPAGAPVAGYLEVPYTAVHMAEYSSRGYWVTTGDTTGYEIVLHHGGGRQLRIQSDLRAVPVTDREREVAHYQALYAIRERDANADAPVDRIPASKAFVRRLTTDSDGRIWAQLYQPGVEVQMDTTTPPCSGPFCGKLLSLDGSYDLLEPNMRKPASRFDEPVVYDVFTAAGDFLGRVALPQGSTFKSASREHVWLQESDADGVPYLVRYRVGTTTGAELPFSWR